MKIFDVIIIGGGISGLHTAFELAKKGASFKLLEARTRFGGRIYSPKSKSKSGVDIGPSWIWPGQNNVERLLGELGLEFEIFEQFHQGDSLYESADGSVLRGVAGFSMAGSFRIRGGLQTLTDALVTQIQSFSNDSLSLDSKVNKILLGNEGNEVSVNGETFRAKKIILALPPRVAMQEIEFSPPLSRERVNDLNSIATWMAGHAKMVAIYEEPFWRNMGLSGDVFSQKGPLSEIHDASSADGDMFSLFGFFGTPPKERLTDKALVDINIIQQLTQLFGEKAASPLEIIYKNWASDLLTATSFDLVIPDHHPTNVWSQRVEKTFNNSLIWSGSESASGPYNGYIEGAIVASYTALSHC